MAVGKAIWKILDFALEASTHAVYIPQLTAGNIAGVTTLVGNYLTALDAITLGRIARETLQAAVVELSGAAPSSPFAQREVKWLVPYADTVTGKSYQLEIPTPNLALLASGTDFMDMAQADAIAFKTAFEALVKSPDGNAVTMGTPKCVGRNL